MHEGGDERMKRKYLRKYSLLAMMAALMVNLTTPVVFGKELSTTQLEQTQVTTSETKIRAFMETYGPGLGITSLQYAVCSNG